MLQHVVASLKEAQAALNRLLDQKAMLEEIAGAGEMLAQCFQKKGRVFSCGNGGSMCDAMHFAEELSGRFRKDRAALPAVAIADPAHITCTANDFGYDAIFSRYLEAHGAAGDVLVAITTSGKSPNVLAAAATAKAKGMQVIALTGKPQSPISGKVDIEIVTPGGAYADRVQELHIKVIHTLIELVERQLFPECYR